MTEHADALQPQFLNMQVRYYFGVPSNKATASWGSAGSGKTLIGAPLSKTIEVPMA